MATRDALIIGHGGFRESRDTINVPENCDVHFYVPHGDTMNAAILRDMLEQGSIKFHESDAGTV